MSDAVSIALIASIAPTIAALAALVVSVLNSRRLVEIHTLTNSNLSKVTAALAVANEKIEGLRLLAAAVAIAAEKERK